VIPDHVERSLDTDTTRCFGRQPSAKSARLPTTLGFYSALQATPTHAPSRLATLQDLREQINKVKQQIRQLKAGVPLLSPVGKSDYAHAVQPSTSTRRDTVPPNGRSRDYDARPSVYSSHSVCVHVRFSTRSPLIASWLSLTSIAAVCVQPTLTHAISRVIFFPGKVRTTPY